MQRETRDGFAWLRQLAGWGLLIAGIAGCVLPILPGFPLVIAGLLVLSRDYSWARRAVGKARRWAVKLRRKARATRRGAQPDHRTSPVLREQAGTVVEAQRD